MVKTRALDLHVYPADMRFQGRILQIADHLHRKGIFSAVELVGTSDTALPALEVLANGVIVRRFRLHRGRRGAFASWLPIHWGLWCARIVFHYASLRIACVSAHSVQVLPLCWLISVLKTCPLLYEPHELETALDASGNWAGKSVRQFCERLFIRRARRVTVANPHTAKWYERTYGLGKVWVIRNIPAPEAVEPLPENYFATRFRFSPSDIVFLYQGLIEKHRGIEKLVEAFEQVPHDRHIVILGSGSLVPFVTAAAARLPNVHIHPAVPPHDLVRYAAAADVGVMMFENYSLHYRYCYPGKYCQYLSAGKAVLVSDFLLLCEEVTAFNCGWPAPPDSRSVARIVRQIDRSEIVLKEKGARAWAAHNSWIKERRVIDDVYSDLLEA